MPTSSPVSDQDKLYPLRKFSYPGIYSNAYLSQLVQRKKLKAKQIGRNYYTCQRWFNEYLDRHARDSKQIAYSQALKAGGYRPNAPSSTVFSQQGPKTGEPGVFVYENPRPRFFSRAALSFALGIIMTLLLVALGNIYLADKDQGRVAGEAATSTESNLINNIGY